PLVDEPDVEIPEPVAAEAEAEMSEADEAAPAAVDEEPAETVTVDLVDGKAAAEHDEPLAAITPLHRGPYLQLLGPVEVRGARGEAP
ncbi:hypothetical protein ACP3W1_25015, partial [Salmonella enterica]|uniref:hypothetical protein n=1 Tax=Salmonella enterica TaxID=28901 RepID=UPI003CFA2A10